jgi:hypothetical protein
MSSGVTPVLIYVVLTAMHIWSSVACPVRPWRWIVRVVVLRGIS